MLAAVHARDDVGTKFNVTYSQLANTSSPSTVYTYISNFCVRIFGLTPFGKFCKMSKNSFKRSFCVDKSIYLYCSQDRIRTCNVYHVKAVCKRCYLRPASTTTGISRSFRHLTILFIMM